MLIGMDVLHLFSFVLSLHTRSVTFIPYKGWEPETLKLVSPRKERRTGNENGVTNYEVKK